MRTRDALVEAKIQLGDLKVSDPTARKCIRNARRILSTKSLAVALEPWHRNVASMMEAR
jgi:hypothetical protein